jgi:hypothetical protein
MAWVRGFACASEVLKRLDPTAAERALGRLRVALAAHLSDGGVWFNSHACVVTARRRWRRGGTTDPHETASSHQ